MISLLLNNLKPREHFPYHVTDSLITFSSLFAKWIHVLSLSYNSYMQLGIIQATNSHALHHFRQQAIWSLPLINQWLSLQMGKREYSGNPFSNTLWYSCQFGCTLGMLLPSFSSMNRSCALLIYTPERSILQPESSLCIHCDQCLPFSDVQSFASLFSIKKLCITALKIWQFLAFPFAKHSLTKVSCDHTTKGDDL